MPYPYSYAYHHHHCHHHPVPPPVHTDLCVPYDDTRIWKALEDLHKHLHKLIDEEREQRKVADQALLDKIEQEIQDRKDADQDLQDQMDTGFEKVNNYITNIYDVLNTIINGGKTTVLYRGTDYTITFYNGYGVNTDTIEDDTVDEAFYIYEITTDMKGPDKEYITHEIHVISDGMTHGQTGRCSLSNSRTITPGVEQAPYFKHTKVALDYQDCWIASIRLNGDYGSFQAFECPTTNVWNMSPTGYSWAITAGGTYGEISGTNRLLLYPSSISDGHNSQYYAIADSSLTYKHLNYHGIFTFLETKDV